MLCWFLPYNSVNQPQVYMCPLPLGLPSYLPTPSHLSGSSLSPGLSSLCYTTTSPQPSILHVVMYMFQCYTLKSSHPLLPLLCLQVYSLCLCLYFCPENRFISAWYVLRTKNPTCCLPNTDLNTHDCKLYSGRNHV